MSILGILLAVVAIIGGHVFEGGKIASISQPTAALIVLGGTIGAVLLSFPSSKLMKAVKSVKTVFIPPKSNIPQIIDQIVNFATEARRNGIIAIEKSVAALEDQFLKKALNLAVDGSDAKAIRHAMEIDITVEENDLEAPVKIFETAGGFAPTVGILGAVMGLINVMENLSDPSKLGAGIAVAFVATLYGVGLANLVVLPLSNKLKMRMKEHVMLREMMLEGVIAIVDGENPRLIKEKLSSYMSDAEKKKASSSK